MKENKDMEVGKTYYATLGYYSHGKVHPIPDSNTTITLKDAGGFPSLSYRNFTLDKTVIAPDEEITVSFDVDNAGSYGEREFGIFVFNLYADGGSLAGFRTNKVDLNRGTTTVTKPCTIELSEGCYYFLVYILENGTWIKISNYLFFDVTDEATAISSVTGDTEVQDQYYDLQGHRVSSPTKGLYIKNGKKFVKHK